MPVILDHIRPGGRCGAAMMYQCGFIRGTSSRSGSVSRHARYTCLSPTGAGLPLMLDGKKDCPVVLRGILKIYRK